MHQSHRPSQGSTGLNSERLWLELLENLRNEFMTMENELNLCKMQRDNYEQKLDAQLLEFQSMKQTILELDMNYRNMKQQYEQQLFQLKAQIKQQQQQQQQQGGGGGANGIIDIDAPPPAHSSIHNRNASPLNDSQQQQQQQQQQHGGTVSPYGLAQYAHSQQLPSPAMHHMSAGYALPGIGSGVQQLLGSDANRGAAAATTGSTNNNNNSGQQQQQQPQSQQQQQYQQQQRKDGVPIDQQPGSMYSVPSNNYGSAQYMQLDDQQQQQQQQQGNKLPSLQIRAMDNLMISSRDHNITPNSPGGLAHTANNNSMNEAFMRSAMMSSISGGNSAATPSPVADGGGSGGTMLPPPAQLTRGGSTSAASASTAAADGAALSSDAMHKREGKDWVAIINPQYRNSTDISLQHSLDLRSVVCAVKFSHDGKYIATGSNKAAQVFDVDTAQCVRVFNTCGPSSQESGVTSTSSSANKSSGSKTPTAAASAKDPVLGCERLDFYVRSVCFSPNGRHLASTEDNVVRIWDISSGVQTRSFDGHTKDIYSVDFSSDNRTVVSGAGDGRIKVWNIDSGRCELTLHDDITSGKETVVSVALSPDGRYVATGSLDSFVRVWDLTTGKLAKMFRGHADSAHSVAYSPDGKTIASGSLDKTVRLWDINSGECTSTMASHRDFVLSVAFSADGNWLLSGSKDRSVQVWDTRVGHALCMMLQGHKNSVISVAINPKRPMIATGSGDFTTRLWQCAIGQA